MHIYYFLHVSRYPWIRYYHRCTHLHWLLEACPGSCTENVCKFHKMKSRSAQIGLLFAKRRVFMCSRSSCDFSWKARFLPPDFSKFWFYDPNQNYCRFKHGNGTNVCVHISCDFSWEITGLFRHRAPLSVLRGLANTPQTVYSYPFFPMICFIFIISCLPMQTPSSLHLLISILSILLQRLFSIAWKQFFCYLYLKVSVSLQFFPSVLLCFKCVGFHNDFSQHGWLLTRMSAASFLSHFLIISRPSALLLFLHLCLEHSQLSIVCRFN